MDMAEPAASRYIQRDLEPFLTLSSMPAAGDSYQAASEVLLAIAEDSLKTSRVAAGRDFAEAYRARIEWAISSIGAAYMSFCSGSNIKFCSFNKFLHVSNASAPGT